jgi:zinc transporter
MESSWAYCILERGAARRISLEEAEKGCAGAALTWMHIEGTDANCLDWLSSGSGLPEPVVSALLAAETRPRANEMSCGVIVNLRGVNMAPDADPEDLVSIRLWAEANRVISVSYRPLMALADMRAKVEAARILDPGDFIAALAGVLVERLIPVIVQLGDEVDELEEDIGDRGRWREISAAVSEVRRTAIGLKRYIAPQKEAIGRLIASQLPWLTDEDRAHLKEAADHVSRMAEELESVRDRAAVLRDELTDLAAERINQRALILSITAAVYLPLTFITGLLGMNVAGIPFADEPWAFSAVLVGTAVFALALLAWFRYRRWF